MVIMNKLFAAAYNSNLSNQQSTVMTVQQQQRSAARKSYQSPKSTKTAKGAEAFDGTGSSVLDMFSKGPTYRLRSEDDIIALVEAAWQEEPALFGACLFYIRDILEGQKERRFFRVAIKYLAAKAPELAKNLLPFFPMYGRWDDLFALEGTPVFDNALNFYAQQLLFDSEKLSLDTNASISLAAKWAPSEKAGKEDRRLWRIFHQKIGTPKQYRKLISSLRKRLNLVETSMCQDKWEQINYSSVPSRAALIYRSAFKKHDKDRYQEFLDSLKGKSKEEVAKQLKATTLNPCEIVGKYLCSRSGDDDTLNLLWEALPDFLKGRHRNSLAIVDTSGSMTIGNIAEGINPLTVAISLGMYLAERADGIWKDKFITFSTNPQFVTLKGKTLKERIDNMSKAGWSMSTNFNAVFTEMLKLAKNAGLSQEDLPETIYVISDMQFDEAASNTTNFAQIDDDFRRAGYTRPNIVFWTVTGSKATPVTFGQYGVAMVGGFSPTLFQQLMGDNTTPESMMRQVLESERYECVRNVFSLSSL